MNSCDICVRGEKKSFSSLKVVNGCATHCHGPHCLWAQARAADHTRFSPTLFFLLLRSLSSMFSSPPQRSFRPTPCIPLIVPVLPPDLRPSSKHSLLRCVRFFLHTSALLPLSPNSELKVTKMIHHLPCCQQDSWTTPPLGGDIDR